MQKKASLRTLDAAFGHAFWTQPFIVYRRVRVCLTFTRMWISCSFCACGFLVRSVFLSPR